jgi:hypothetical protein
MGPWLDYVDDYLGRLMAGEKVTIATFKLH